MSIVDGWALIGFENEYVSVADIPRETLCKHPWSLGGGGVAELKDVLDSQRSVSLASLVVSIGRVAHTGADGAYVAERADLVRRQLPAEQIAVFVEGDKLRDSKMATELTVGLPAGERVFWYALGLIADLSAASRHS